MRVQVYHGSRNKGLNQLCCTYSGSGVVGSRPVGGLFFATDLETALHYIDLADEDEDKELEYVYVCELTFDNPLVIESGGQSPTWHVLEAQLGEYDSLIIRNVSDGAGYGDIYAVWNNSQIRIIGNAVNSIPESM